MNLEKGAASAQTTAAGRFFTTRWSVVLAAGAGEQSAAESLETLCRIYWLPLYAFARREGYLPAEAQDFTQEFFSRLLAGNYLAQVSPAKGRFRSFLLASFRHFLSDQRDRARAAKRGGGLAPISIDFTNAEALCGASLTDTQTPAALYEQRWAVALLSQARERLSAECESAGKAELYRALGETEPGESQSSYREIGARLGMSEGAVKLAAFRLRQRFQEIIREEIAATVSDDSEIEEEIKHLLSVLGGCV